MLARDAPFSFPREEDSPLQSFMIICNNIMKEVLVHSPTERNGQ